MVQDCNNIETHHNNFSCMYHHHMGNNMNHCPLRLGQVIHYINQLFQLHITIQSWLRLMLWCNRLVCVRDWLPHYALVVWSSEVNISLFQCWWWENSYLILSCLLHIGKWIWFLGPHPIVMFFVCLDIWYKFNTEMFFVVNLYSCHNFTWYNCRGYLISGWKFFEPHISSHHNFYDKPGGYLFECKCVTCCLCYILDGAYTPLQLWYVFFLSNCVGFNIEGC